MKKIIGIFAVILLVVLFSGCKKTQPIPVEKNLPVSGEDNTTENNNLIGGDKDEHGCLCSAGYQWCPSTEKCQRMWEEYCEEYKNNFRGDSADDSAVPVPE